VVQTGLPILDRWNANVALLADWLGRFAAEPVWEGETVAFYVRDDDRGRLGGITCVPTTEADLQGPLREEFQGLKDRLQQAVPRSSSGHTMHRFLSQGLLAFRPEADPLGLKWQLFKYRDLLGTWRLVWCCGHLPRPDRSAGQPVVCGNPDCHQLALVEGGAVRKCARCGRSVAAQGFVRRRWKLLLALLLLLLVGGGGAAYAYLRPSAILAGHVVRAADGAPLTGAEARIEGDPRTTVTDGPGSFRLVRLPAGKATLKVSARGFSEQSVPVEMSARNETSVDVRMTGVAQLSGRVVYLLDDQELGLAQARVATVGLDVAPVESDDSGSFQCASLPPGPLRLQVTATGFAATEVTGQALVGSASGGSGEAPLRVVLAGDCSLGGRVVHAADPQLPIADAEIRVRGLDQTPTRTDADGRFQLAGVPPARVELRASAAGFRANSVPAEPGAVALSIPLAGDASVQGTVLRGDTKQPVPNAQVLLSGTPFKTRTDERGVFRWAEVRSGPVNIAASVPGWTASLAKDLPAGQETTVEIVLTGAATARGRVVKAGDRAAVSNATITVTQTGAQATSGARGEFTLPEIPASQLTLQVSAEGYIPRDVPQELQAGAQDLEEIALIPAVAIEGVVVRAVDGGPIPGAMVAVAEPRATAQTDKDGKFTITGVPLTPLRVGAMAKGFSKNIVQAEPGKEPLRIELTGDAVLRGRVTRSDTQQPVAGAEVCLNAAGAQFKTQTDQQGQFHL
ncbi:MAG: carboxypeptidase regulatory-like domain-containing protein, partial [Planctomycetota bacterium]|nr:carboxypeptidase regulatory-like domain-containing protein [Planctomycetota bacterium]